jgi:1-acyl-sn-glycerol-3-phosphate acyltransferase
LISDWKIQDEDVVSHRRLSNLMTDPDIDPAKSRKGWFYRGFRDHYCLRYVRKHFHAVRLAHDSHPIPNDTKPIIVVLNHPSWWDPLIFIVLSREFGNREHYGIINSAMMNTYGFFKWLGIFGVESSVRGAIHFLKTSVSLLNKSSRVLWITAQGRFTDVRARPLNLQPGAGHLAARLPDAWILPIAIEYVFWNEKSPEALIRIGEPVLTGPGSGAEWTVRIEQSLTTTLDRLNSDTMTRDPKRFRLLLGGSRGVGGFYGRWQRLKSWVKFQKYQPDHDASSD